MLIVIVSKSRYLDEMIRVFIFIAVIFSLVASGQAQETQSAAVTFKEVRVHEGDHPGYAAPEYDDADWLPVSRYRIDPQGRMIWVRAYVDGNQLKAATAERPLGFFFSALASREVFFNGVSIGASGTPGVSADAEIPGPLDAVYYIPTELIRPGANVLAIRISSHHLGARVRGPIHSFRVGSYEGATKHRIQSYIPAIAAGGAISLGAFYFLGLFAANRRELTSLALGILAFAVVGQLGAEVWRAFNLYFYPTHMLRIYLMLGFAALAGAALFAFSGLRFAPHRAKSISVVAVVTAGLAIYLAPGYDGKIALVFLTFMTAALVAALIGATNSERGARLSAAGFAIFILIAFIAPQRFLDQTYYLIMAMLMIVLFTMQIRLLGFERHARETAALEAVRLRHELLKKQIQPHFLMNTLTTLSEWIESEPKTGVAMIDALSNEFRLLHDISDKTLISLDDELELCRQHLMVMSLRADAAFTLHVDGGTSDIQCPPAVLLTLIENAFTHNEYRDDATFEINATQTGRDIAIICRAPIQTTINRSTQPGTGLAYIRARLKEAFGENWTLRSKPTNKAWETTISWRVP